MDDSACFSAVAFNSAGYISALNSLTRCLMKKGSNENE